MAQRTPRDTILVFLAQQLKKNGAELDSILTVPPQRTFGDFALPCFFLAQERKQAPNLIAQQLVRTLAQQLPKGVSRVEAQGPYLNFFVDQTSLGFLANILPGSVLAGHLHRNGKSQPRTASHPLG